MTVITDSDLNAYVTGSMASLIADKELLTRCHHVSFQFVNTFSDTAEQFRQRRFVVPRDCFVETVSLSGFNDGVLSTVSVNIVGDGALVNWPINVSASFTNYVNINRLWYNNATTKYADRAFRVFPQGSTITITISNTKPSGGTNTHCNVGFVLRQFYGR